MCELALRDRLRIAVLGASMCERSQEPAHDPAACLACVDLGVDALLRTLGAMTEESVLAAAARVAYVDLCGYPPEEYPDAAIGIGTILDMLRAAAPLLGARQAAEIEKQRRELQARKEILDHLQTVAGAGWWHGVADVITTLRAQLATAEGDIASQSGIIGDYERRLAAAELRAERGISLVVQAADAAEPSENGIRFVPFTEELLAELRAFPRPASSAAEEGNEP